ncbi:hypothetical protein GF325_09095 [Candidatus Bathyarchaeota archaeon]|nr:hypothetical protein [Candidatus Bathyarchaeota archaeon]
MVDQFYWGLFNKLPIGHFPWWKNLTLTCLSMNAVILYQESVYQGTMNEPRDPELVEE